MNTMYWFFLILLLIFLLLLDLFVFQRKSHTINLREALFYSIFWISLGLLFGIVVYNIYGINSALEYYGAYLVELSLSVDNLFIFIVIFAFFRVPQEYRHKVLYLGIIGAFILRITFILIGIRLVREFEWLLYIFGAILIYSSIKLLSSKDRKLSIADNPVIKFVNKFIPVIKEYRDGKFLVKENKKIYITPLFLTLIAVETSDLMFALDSIPAVFGITLDPFIAFSSNAFAVLGLRALYFAIANLIELIRFLNYGLSCVLLFIGLKMIFSHFVTIPIYITLLVIALIISATVIVSILFPKKSD